MYTKQIAQVKEVMREPSSFEGTLDSNHYLKWVQAFEGYLRVRGCSNEVSFVIAIETLQGVTYYWFICLRRQRALQDKLGIKTWH